MIYLKLIKIINGKSKKGNNMTKEIKKVTENNTNNEKY